MPLHLDIDPELSISSKRDFLFSAWRRSVSSLNHIAKPSFIEIRGEPGEGDYV